MSLWSDEAKAEHKRLCSRLFGRKEHTYDTPRCRFDAHVYEYWWHLPMRIQWAACDKVWKAHSKGKMTLDQAIEASHRTGQKMRNAYERLGYTVEHL
jgi:hypothetical protein